jgi:HSP20 family protein
MDRIGDDELRDLGGPGSPSDAERETRLRRRHYARPAVDIYSTDTEMVVLADLPGVRKSELAITLERDELVIEGRITGREEEESSLPWGYHRRFKLRSAFERDRIRGHIDGGVLEVRLPKSSGEQPRKVALD